jgi:hypothetical protein
MRRSASRLTRPSFGFHKVYRMSQRLAVVLCLVGSMLLPSAVLARGHRGGGGFGMIFSAAAAWSAQRAAWERREAAAEKIRRAKNNQERMKYADQARKQGKPRLAATLYLRVALSRGEKNAGAAKAALKQMAAEGQAEMKKADELLAQGKIVEAFEKLDYLAWAYEDVPNFNEEIKSHVTRLHNESRYQAVLNEKPAADMLTQAQAAEQDDARCCAFWMYEATAKLVPAPSAIQAEERYEAMKKDPKIVAEAEECRTLHECDKLFHQAELLEKSLPEKAEALFKDILAKAPRDSEVHQSAKQELAKLHPGAKR